MATTISAYVHKNHSFNHNFASVTARDLILVSMPCFQVPGIQFSSFQSSSLNLFDRKLKIFKFYNKKIQCIWKSIKFLSPKNTFLFIFMYEHTL